MVANFIPFQSAEHITAQLPSHCRALRTFLLGVGRMLFDIKVEGRQNIPEGNCVIVANHLSWLDAILLLLYLPPEPRIYILGAAQAIDQPWKKRLIEWLDMMVPAVRGACWVGKDVLAKPLKILESGASLAIFPEGDVGPRESELMPLQTGVGHLLKHADVPVLPIALSGTRELWWHKRIRVIIGRPFRVTAPRGGNHVAVTAIVAQVTDQMQRLIPRYVEPVGVRKPLRHLLTDLPDLGA